MIMMSNYSNEYRIKFELKHTVLFGNNIDINTISFTDILDREVLSINISTDDILNLIDRFYNYYIFGMDKVSCPIGINPDMSYFIFTMEQNNNESNEEYGDIFTVYHSIGNNHIKVLRIDLYESVGTECTAIEFIYSLYDEFLRDKYNLGDLCPDLVME